MAERWLFSLKNMHMMKDQPAGVAVDLVAKAFGLTQKQLDELM